MTLRHLSGHAMLCLGGTIAAWAAVSQLFLDWPLSLKVMVGLAVIWTVAFVKAVLGWPARPAWRR